MQVHLREEHEEEKFDPEMLMNGKIVALDWKESDDMRSECEEVKCEILDSEYEDEYVKEETVENDNAEYELIGLDDIVISDEAPEELIEEVSLYV